MDNRPIGVFDSGVGGLTVVRELQALLPGEDILYFGDTGRVPYGTRSRQIIRKYAAQDIQYLVSNGVKAVVAACGTVSANFSVDDVRAMGCALPYITIVEPASRAACAQSKTGRIGVIATSASIRSGAYDRHIAALRPDTEVFGGACPLLVPLAENGLTQTDNPIACLTVDMYLRPLRRENIDTLILGCTHYPLFRDLIDQLLEYRVALVDAGAAAAATAGQVLRDAGLLAAENRAGTTRYHVTDTVDNFLEVAQLFLQGMDADAVQYVDIEQIEGHAWPEK